MFRLAELERRVDGMMLRGTVGKVDAANHKVRLKIGTRADGSPLLGPWISYAQIAGALKIHSTPSEDQQMVAFSPSGDRRQAIAFPYGWSNQNPAPSTNADHHLMTFGSMKFDLKKEEMVTDGKIFVGGAGVPKVMTENGPSNFLFARV